MGVILAIPVFVLGIIASALSRVLADDFKEWTPWFVGRLIQLAVMRLPKSQQIRYSEEWRSHVNDIPGHFGKLWVAYGFFRAANKIAVAEKAVTTKRIRIETGDVTRVLVQLTAFFVGPVFLLRLLSHMNPLSWAQLLEFAGASIALTTYFECTAYSKAKNERERRTHQ
ncbi:MAG TPA: hypothetical protein VGK22_08605 [Candidatus Angelobacter sp.]|jgi:hypothetical protein